jgi:two-component system, OmpR family, sensor kinase
VRFRTRLLLAAAYLLLVVVIALEIPLGVSISKRARSELQSSLVASASLVAARINDDLPDAGFDPATSPNPPAFVTDTVNTTAQSTEARIVVTDLLGRVVADSDGEAQIGESYMTPDRPEFASVFDGKIDVRTRHSDTLNEDLLLVTAPVVHQRQVIGAVRLSQTLRHVNDGVRRSLIGLAVVGGIVILVGLGLAWLLSNALARPIRRLAGTATRLGEGDLDARANVSGQGELAILGRNFNRMADGLSANIRAQRDFLANASHQLRTPLTGLRLRLEAIEADGGPAAEQATKAQAEVTRLSLLVEDLLELARATSAEATGARVDLAETAREAVDRWSAPAAEGGKRLVERIGASAAVWASRQDLDHVLDNLIENGIRYAPEGSEIIVETNSPDGVPTLAVSDTGPGISEEDRQRVFERFYRGSTGKKAGPGTGLGLAVAAELVERWGGTLRLADGAGTRFEAAFPAPPTVP